MFKKAVIITLSITAADILFSSMTLILPCPVSVYLGPKLATVYASDTFLEGWEGAEIGVFEPDSIIASDSRDWLLADTVSEFPEDCGLTPHRAEILSTGGNRVLRLTSEESNSDCSDNIWVLLTEVSEAKLNIGFAIPFDEHTYLSFDESGWLNDPGKHGWGINCLSPPCFDNISLQLEDHRGNVLTYVLQRYAEANPDQSRSTYREIFLDPDAKTYVRRILDDFESIPAFDFANAQIKSIVFKIDKHGTASIDNIYIGPNPPNNPGNVDRIEILRAFVSRFYQLCLSRDPEPDGLDYWVTSLLDRTRTGAEVAKGFIFSQEFMNRNVSNEDFLEILYEAFFDRSPDIGGYNYWLDQLKSNVERSQILDGFIYSTEFANLCDEYDITAFPPTDPVVAFVTRFYQLCLGRDPEQAGLDYWVNSLKDGSRTGGDVAFGFVFSQEFTNMNTSNEQYLDILYHAFFDREPDQGGFNGWLSQLNSGVSREDVLRGFIYAQEFYNLCNQFGIKPN